MKITLESIVLGSLKIIADNAIYVIEARDAGYKRNFIGLNAGELKAALVAADDAGEPWPHPIWLKKASPEGMKGVETGWENWRSPAPEGAIVLVGWENEQHDPCSCRWFLFPSRE